MPTYTKGVVPLAEPEPTRGVPSAAESNLGVPSLVATGKGPKPEVQSQVPSILQGKGPKAVGNQLASAIPQQIVPQQVPVLPQSKGPKPASGQFPVASQLLASQGKAPKPEYPGQVFPFIPQGQAPKPEKHQHVFSNANAQHPVAPGLLPALPQSKASQSFIPQTKGPKPVAADVLPRQTEGPPPAPEPTHAMTQLKGPKAANSGKCLQSCGSLINSS